MRLYHLAAQQGLQDAQFNLAISLSKGRGCDKSPVQAGCADAQTELVKWCMLGECGLPTNYKEAMRLAKLGAAAGNAFTMNHISSLFHSGWGVAENLDEASNWYRQAAALGNEAAKTNLRTLARAGHAPPSPPCASSASARSDRCFSALRDATTRRSSV